MVSAGGCHTSEQACVGDAAGCQGPQGCTDAGVLLPNGASCGTDLVCSGGTCIACAAGSSCVPASTPCHGGLLNCSNGTPTCVEQPSVLVDGTFCGSGLICNAGACIACSPGNPCSSGNACWVSEMTCDNGVPSCVPIASFTDGTYCGNNMVCESGNCVSGCGDGGVLRSGACDAGGS